MSSFQLDEVDEIVELANAIRSLPSNVSGELLYWDSNGCNTFTAKRGERDLMWRIEVNYEF